VIDQTMTDEEVETFDEFKKYLLSIINILNEENH
jgi:hypothetical protein